MNKLVLISISLILTLTSSAFSMSSNKAVILKHKTEVTGADSQGRAVSGHLDNGPIIYSSKPKDSSNIALNKKKNKSAPTK
ncbi:MAG: hypothetical protein WC785_09720 [Tatlockia sp.]|jgi:hypothetical protein